MEELNLENIINENVWLNFTWNELSLNENIYLKGNISKVGQMFLEKFWRIFEDSRQRKKNRDKGRRAKKNAPIFGEHKILFAHSLKLYSFEYRSRDTHVMTSFAKLHSRAPIRINTRLHLRHKVQKDGVGSFAFDTRILRSETLLVRF